MPKSPTDWMKLLLSTGEYADLVPAHKLILKHASDVFEAMFRFDSQNAKAENVCANCNVVEVPDVEAAAFKVMLSFIYAGDLSGLNGDNAMAVLYAAKKYNIPALVAPSLQIPISELRNVFLAYAQARLFDLEEFANCCLSYIDKNADILIKSDEFLQIDQKLLCEILERDELQIREEISTWDAALRWSDAKCRENAIGCSAENRRAVLGPALFKIRFPLFAKKEFLKIVPSKVLTAEEKFGIYQFQSQPHFHPLKFPSHWRIWTFGTISMDIKKVSEFAREPMESYRFSDDTVCIKGLPWKIVAQIKAKTKSTENEKSLGIFLWCNGPREAGENWSCKCSATFRIVSKMDSVENSIGKFNDLAFNNKQQGRGFNFIPFAELMELTKGFYDKNGDKITVAIDFAVGEPKADKSIYDSCKSHGTLSMEIEKVSEFAREIIGSERKSEFVTYIKGLPWKISSQIKTKRGSTDNEKYLGIFLSCVAPKNEKWSCKCSATFRIVSQKCGVPDIKNEFIEEINFNSESVAMGFSGFISFAELMDLEKGFYDQREDKVTLAIDVTVKEAKTRDK
ncbi:hypothetical protein niasHT_014526 [Heterodera trifolii]|uniref:BTB domain-containing protein n=1 Tax=Heterodera trifolii TaxID=157864 RepID=A0ABD2KZI8_9BILA